ncbi:defensin-like protein 1 [Wolffia australiana]
MKIEADLPGPAEAKLCESQSHNFKGTCTNDHNCALVCRAEKFPGGHCRGFWRKCYCTRPCKNP